MKRGNCRSQSLQQIHGLQAEIGRQAEVLQRAVEATGEVDPAGRRAQPQPHGLGRRETFEQTVLSLAAALNLLGARLAETPGGTMPIKLEPPRRAAQAA